MIIDFHTHIFPAEVKEKREEFFDDPAFRLLYSSKNSKIITAEELISSMDENRISRCVVFGFPWKEERNFKMHNDYIIEAANKYSDRIWGFCCVYPLNKKAEDEVARCLDAGLKGVGEIAFYDSDINEEIAISLKGIMDICLEKDCPFVLHTNEPVGHKYPGKSPMSLSNLYNFIKMYPNNKIVLAHWGGGLFFYSLMKREVKEVLKNVWFDTAASPYLYTKDIYTIASYIIGPEKILFGSDFPLIPPRRYFDEMEEAGLSPEEGSKIMEENALELLKWKG